jgi:pimeloyl-ACP methyl ester carboxylesterase
MNRAQIGEIALEYEVRGSGEPVVLIHGGIIADGLRPLFTEPSLTERYQLFLYHRRGFAGSTHLDAPITIAQQAADCRAFLEQMGFSGPTSLDTLTAETLPYSSRWMRQTSSIPSRCSSQRCSPFPARHN